MTTVDLRSDTVTRPTPQMRRAIAGAEVGDAVLGDDPTVAELERLAAVLLGKEASLFFPSGIMANTTALLLHAAPGSQVVIDAAGHILQWEEGAGAAWGGVLFRTVASEDGHTTPEALRAAVAPPSPYLPRTSLLCLENTHNAAGGRVLSAAATGDVAAAARELGLRVHLDGARLPNAAVASGSTLAELAAPVDTVMVSLSKGLGAPVGAVLAGTGEAMREGWRLRRRLGGGMRQAGILAAAGIFALRNHLGRLADDHRRARDLAAAAGAVEGVSVLEPETNIVMIDLDDPRLHTGRLLAALERRGARLAAFGPRRLRAVTHLDVDDEGISLAARALREAVDELGG
jgi:threonine aldolase